MGEVVYKFRSKMVDKCTEEFNISDALAIKFLMLTGDDFITLRNACNEYCKRKAAGYSEDSTVKFILDGLMYGDFNKIFGYGKK